MTINVRTYEVNGLRGEAVQLTRENVLTEDRDDVHEWVDGKLFFSPVGAEPEAEIETPWINSPALRVTGLSVFTPGGKVKANWGDWIVRTRKGHFWVVRAEDFEKDYREVEVTR